MALARNGFPPGALCWIDTAHGSVLVAPFDADAVRIAVLSDPGGAAFAVNQLVVDAGS